MKNNKKLIGTRINTALADKKITQKELADYLKVKPNVISYFCSGERTPNTEQIIMIAEYLSVSTDYLLGRTNSKSIDNKFRAAVDVTGLSEEAITALQNLSSKEKGVQQVIEAILQNKLFEEAILDIIHLLTYPTDKPENYFEFEGHSVETKKFLRSSVNDELSSLGHNLLTDEKLKGVLNNGKH